MRIRLLNRIKAGGQYHAAGTEGEAEELGLSIQEARRCVSEGAAETIGELPGDESAADPEQEETLDPEDGEPEATRSKGRRGKAS